MPTTKAAIKNDDIELESIAIDVDWLLEKAVYELGKKGIDNPTQHQILKEVNKHIGEWTKQE
jgi:hypothetical protein